MGVVFTNLLIKNVFITNGLFIACGNLTSRERRTKIPSTLMRFRLMCFDLASTLKPSKTLIISIENPDIPNALQGGGIWKHSPIVLVWTAKTEALENDDVTTDT